MHGAASKFAAGALAGLVLMLAMIAVPLGLIAGGGGDGEDCGGTHGIVLGPPGQGTDVGATVFGDRTGYRGDNLARKPDSYAELGGTSEQTATLLGGLPYRTPLRVTLNRRSAVLYKRDIGLGQGTRTIDGRRFGVDLYVVPARVLGVDANWSGMVRVERVKPAAVDTLAAQTGPGTLAGGGCGSTAGLSTISGRRARVFRDGSAAAPAAAPAAVKAMIAAANRLRTRPYRYGGGHASFDDTAYDCSGAVSYVLHAGGVLDSPLDSSDLERWGDGGPGAWVTVYANPGHAYMTIAGLRFDTSAAGEAESSGSGPRWRTASRPAGAFHARHPKGL